jgi:hypothetical protein
MRIALQRLLHHQRKFVEPFPHIGMARRQPHPTLRRDWDRAATARASDDTSTSAPTTIR